MFQQNKTATQNLVSKLATGDYIFLLFFFFFSLFFQFDELLRDCIREMHSARNETECGAAAKGADADVHFVGTFSKRGPRSGPQTAAQSGTDTPGPGLAHFWHRFARSHTVSSFDL